MSHLARNRKLRAIFNGMLQHRDGSEIHPKENFQTSVDSGASQDRLFLRHQKHCTVQRIFCKPHWCANCGGILIGTGIECRGPCKQRCHYGLGNGTENCYADFLLTPCHDGAALPCRKKPSYHFGDATKQLGRDIHSAIKNQVVVEIVKEQAHFGKLDKIREVAEEIQRIWSDDFVVRWWLLAQLLSAFVMQVGGYFLVLAIAFPLHGQRAWRLASLQATQTTAVIIFVEGVVAFLVNMLSAQMVSYSELVHFFCLEILHIDLTELKVDLCLTGEALIRTSTRALRISVACWLAITCAWYGQLKLA